MICYFNFLGGDMVFVIGRLFWFFIRIFINMVLDVFKGICCVRDRKVVCIMLYLFWEG